MVKPCHNCLDRKLYCHVSCEKYKEFRNEMDEINKKKDQERAVVGAAIAGYRNRGANYKKEHMKGRYRRT